MEKNNSLDHDFCEKFRGEIKARGLAYVVSELLNSSSDKVTLKKQYLARECRKSSFRGKFKEACDALGQNNRQLRPSLMSLTAEICA